VVFSFQHLLFEAIFYSLLRTFNLIYADIRDKFSGSSMQKIKPKNIPNCLRKYRKRRGHKQNYVAKILNIKSASMISRWEKGVCLPDTKNLFRLAAIYRTTPDALFPDLIREMRIEMQRREEKILKRGQLGKQP